MTTRNSNSWVGISCFLSRLEEEWVYFNRFPLGSQDLLEWASHAGLILVVNCKLKSARYEGDLYLSYNPFCQEEELAFSLAQGLGAFYVRKYGGGSENEWAALIVAHLSIFPTNYLQKSIEAAGTRVEDSTWKLLLELTPPQEFQEYDERMAANAHYLKDAGILE